MSPRTFGRRRSSSTSSLNRPLVLAFSIGALLAALSHVTPVSGFLPPASSPMSSSSRAAKHAEQRVSPLFGIKRKVKAEMESNVRACTTAAQHCCSLMSGSRDARAACQAAVQPPCRGFSFGRGDRGSVSACICVANYLRLRLAPRRSRAVLPVCMPAFLVLESPIGVGVFSGFAATFFHTMGQQLLS